MTKVTEKACKKKKMIIENTLNLIKNTDFRNLTVQRICTESKISIGTFYHYFAGKDDMIAAMAESCGSGILRSVKKTLTSDREAANVMRFCKGYAKYMSAFGARYSRILRSGSPCLRDSGESEEKNRPLFLEMRKIFARGIERGQFKPDCGPDLPAEMMLAMLLGVYSHWVEHDGSYDLVAKTAGFVKVFLRAFCAEDFPGGAEEE